MEYPARARALVRADEDYRAAVSPNYDELLDQVTARIADTGSAGKVDIAALVFWKRLNASTSWAARLNTLPEAEVRTITAKAVAAVRDMQGPAPEAAIAGRRALSALPGFRTGDALASAVLTAAAPARMAVYDRRAHQGLRLLEVELSHARGRYGRYIAALCELQDALGSSGGAWPLRRIDTALYWLAAHTELTRSTWGSRSISSSSESGQPTST